MTKKALIILFASIGGAIVVGGTTTAIVISNSTTYVDDPTADTTSFVYNGSEQTYKLQESDLYTITGNKKTDAGEYSVTVSLNKKNKYAWKSTKKSDDLIFNFTIDKKGVLEPSAGTSLFEYTGSEVTYTVTNEDSSFYTVTNNKATNAGTYNAKVSLNDAKNYKWKNSNKSDDLTLPFTISQKDVSSLIAIDDIDDMEYTGEHINPNVTLKTAIPEYEITYGENVNVGKGTVTITAKGNFTGSKTFEFNIVKKTINIPTPTTTEYTYTGSEIVHNIPESGYYDILNNKAINAGNYTATLSLRDKTNTTWSDGTTEDKEFNFTIKPKQILENNVQDINSVTYTGQALTPDVKITTGNYVLIKDTDYTLSYSNNTNAGTASVTITGKGNFTGTVIKTFTINKKVPTVTAPTPVEDLRENGDELELISPGNTTAGTLKYSLSEDGEYSTSIPKVAEHGEYKVYYKVVGDDNVEDVAPQYVTVTVAKPYAQYTAPVKNTLTYDGSAQDLITAGTTSDGTIEYSLDGENYSNSIPTGTDAKEYTVYFRIVPDAEHDAPETTPIIVTIAPKAITITLTAQNDSWTGNEPTVSQTAYTTGDGQLVSGDSLGITITKADGTDVGEYNLTATIINTNYNPTFVNSKFTITAVDPTSTNNPAGIENLVFNDSAQTLITAGEADGGTYMYKLGDGQFGESLPQATNAGSYTITYYIKGDKNHNDSDENSFIVTIDKADATFTAPTAKTLSYTGSAQELVTAGSTSDGTLKYSTTENGTYTNEIPTEMFVDDYTVWFYVEGDDNHNDSVKTLINVSIAKKEISISALESVDYNATAQKPAVTSEYALTDNTFEQTDAGTYNVELVLTDTDNTKWAGLDTTTTTVPWTINKISINTISVTGIEDKTHTGDSVEFTITIKLDDTVLNNNDFQLAYRDSNNQDLEEAPSALGTYKLVITGTNFNGEMLVTFKIVAKVISKSMVQPIADEDRTYTGSAIEPIVIKDGETPLAKGTDYNITYTNNINAGEASYIVTGIGNYGGSFSDTFTILQKIITASMVEEIAENERTYTGSAIEPVKLTDGNKVLILDDDYTISYSNNINASNATYTIEGIGNYTGTVNGSFTIVAKEITSEMIQTIDAKDRTYTGSAIEPIVIKYGDDITLSKVTDYTISYSNNINAGNATYTVTGTGNYTGIVEDSFIIEKATITVATYPKANNLEETSYDQELITNDASTEPAGIGHFEYKLGDGQWDTSIPKAKTKGTYYVYYRVISDNDNYNDRDFDTNIKVIIAESTAKSITDATITMSAESFTYNGQNQTPVITIEYNDITLDEDVHYTLSYNSDTRKDVGTYTITITGDGYFYKGSIEKTYTISKKNINITISSSNMYYNEDGNYDLSTIEVSYTASDVCGSDDLGIVITTTTTIINVGFYTLQGSISNNNYNATFNTNATLQINKIPAEFITLPTAKEGLVFTGSPLVLINEGVVKGGHAEYKVNNGEYSTALPTETYAGTYEIRYKLVGDTNHSDVTITTVTQVTIASKTITKPTADSTEYTYDGTSHTYNIATSEYYTVSDNTTQTGAGDYTITVTLKDTNNTKWNDDTTAALEYTFTIHKRAVTITLQNQSAVYTGNEPEVDDDAYTVNSGLVEGDNLGITITKAPGENVGDYVLSATISNTNYVATINNGSFTITKAEATYTTTPSARTNLVYDGDEQVLLNGGESNCGTVKYSLTENGTYSDVIPYGTNAATYTVWYYIAGDNNHNDSAKVSIPVTIAKKTIESPEKDETVYTYTGSELTYAVATSSDYTVTGNKQTDAGEYTVTISLVDKNNTIWEDNTTNNITYQFVINKATATYTAPTAKNLTYTGEAQALVNAATTSDGTPMYSLTGNEDDYSDVIPTGTNANTYTVWYYILGDGNHNDSTPLTIPATIKKAEVTKPTAPTTNSYTYTGTTITHNLTTSDYYTITDNTAINVGNYTAKVNLNNSNNYCWKETSYTPTSIDELEYVFKITTKALTASMVTLSDNSFVYNGDNQKPTVTVTDSTYLVSTDYELTNNGGIHVGTYDVTVVAQGNYTGSITKHFNITQRPVTIKLNDQSSIYKTNGAYSVEQDEFTVTSGTIITEDDLNIVITKAAGTNVGNYALTATYNNNDYNVTFVNGTYTIESQSINIADATIKLDGTLVTDPTDSTTITYTYNGSVQQPTISIIYNTLDVNDYELVLNTDYTIDINGNQTRATTYTITITAKGNYFTGTTTRMYTIAKKELTDYTLTLETVTYNGTAQAPGTFTLIDNDLSLNVTDSFIITSSTKQTNAGTNSNYKITINPKTGSQSNYENSTINTTYTIQQRNINTCTFSTVYDVPFTDNVEDNGYFPEPTITYNTFNLVKTTDYTLSYGDNNSEGTGTVTITGQGNFTGTKTIGFSIHKNNVTLTFNPNGGSLNDSTEAQNVTFTYPYDTPLPTPTKEHYDFAGWKTSTYPYKTFDVDTTLDKMVGYTTFNAQWTLHNYIITYKNVENDNTYGNPTTRTIEDSAFTLLEPSDSTFLGWYSDESLEHKITIIPAPLGNDMTIYAKWNTVKYDIIYHTNGGDEIENGSYSQSTSTFSLPIPTRDYYDFEGWYENSSLTGTKVTQITQGSTGNKEFWANWTPTTYYITYKLNDGNLDPSNSNPTSYTVETTTFVLNNPTKGGNIFVGWFDDSIGGNKITQITQGSHSNLTLYARYTPIPTTFVIEITHDLSGSTTDQAGTITGENLGTKSVGNSITKTFTVNDTYTFLGWYNGDTLVSSNPELTVTLTENTTTYTAKVARYKLVLNKDSDGGLINPSESQYLRTGDQITLTATTDLGGYVFCGWFRGAETTYVTLEKTLTITMGSEDVTYRAKWSHVTLTILNSDESSNNSVTSMLGKDYVVGGTIDLIATPASGYAFQGWYSGDNKLSGDLTYTYTFKNENETLYAKFVKNLITVNQGLLDTSLTNGDTPEPFFIMSTGGNYGTYGTNNIMDEDELVTYTATNKSDLMFAGWYEIGETGLVVGDPSSTQTTYSLISRDTSIKLAPGTIKTIYPIFISKLGANAQPSTLLPTTSGSNFSGDPLVITPQSSDAYEFTKYTIDGVDVSSSDPILDDNVLSYTENLDTTLASASNYRNRVQIIAVYTRTSALVSAGKLNGSTFVETSAVGSVTKTGDTYTPVAATGYEFVKWQWQKADGSTNRADLTDGRVSVNILTLGSEDYEDYFAIFAPLTNIQYTVNYYLQNTDNDNYKLDHSTTGNNGTTDENLTVTPGTITGATLKTTDLTKTIAGDGSTVFDLYFDRDLITVNYQYNNGTSTSLTPVSVRYGSLPKANTVTGWTKTVAGWYTDCDFTNEFTGTITSTVTLFARWQGDIVLDETDVDNHTAYVGVKVKDSIATTAITNDQNIVIPSYYNGLPVTIVDINNLIVNNKIYSKVTMPDNLTEVIYGQYNSADISWLVLDTTNGYKLLSKNSFGTCDPLDATIESNLSSIKTATGISNIDLLSKSDFETYTNKITELSSDWWLKDWYYAGMARHVAHGSTTGYALYNTSQLIRLYLAL